MILFCLTAFCGAILGSVLAAGDTFRPYSVSEDQLYVNVTFALDSALSGGVCAARCSQLGKGCNGYRFDAATRTCSLGVYDEGEDFAVAYEDGTFPTWWKVWYSDDGCFVRYIGVANHEQLEDFCGRIGGTIPEIRDESDMDRMIQASKGTPLGLTEDPNTPDRWLYDLDGAEAPAELRPAASGGGVDTCARWFVDDGGNHQIVRESCTSRLSFQCQMCK